MPRAYRIAPLPVALATAALVAMAVADAGNLPAELPEQPAFDAIWRVQRFEFTYHSATVYYSCGALRRKIGRILRAVGAHQRVAVEIDCRGRLVNYAFARITLAIPAEASHDNVRAATTYDARTQLLARMRGIKLPTAADLYRFQAARRIVSLTRHPDLQLEPGDCDLLRDLRSQVFPKLGVREQGHGLICTPGGGSRMRPRIEVSALVPVQADEAPASRASG